MQSAQGPSDGVSMLRLHFQTALLHLNPLPNAICQTLSPFLILPFASMYPNSYHSEDDDVLPNLCSVILDASQCSADSCRFFCSSSITALPPAWMQKCSNACLKSGMYGFHFGFTIFLPISVRRKSNCSDAGSTSGPIVVMFDFNASPAIAIRSFESEIPTLPSLSSSSNTHRYALSSDPLWVRTTWTNRYLARRRSDLRFDNSKAAPPIRKRQLGRSIARSLPW
ncbi:hypothetical protein ACE6H2_003191 [Prunus campanulata]